MKPATRKPVRDWVIDGLRIYVRGKTFHAGGTVRVGKASREVRKSLNLPATRENREEAERLARKLVAQVRAQLGGGVTHKSVATLVNERFASPIGQRDLDFLKEFTAKFTTRILYEIPPEEIIELVEERQRGNTPQTRERHISSICSFLNRQINAGQYPALPAFRRDQRARNPDTRKRRPVQQFRKELVFDLITAAHIAIGIQLHIEWACGARVSSVLKGATLESLDMDRMELTFWDTKNGDDVTARLPEDLRPAMEEYLAWRMVHVRAGRIGPGSDEALFLTPKGVPYARKGGSNKTGFKAARRRASATVAARYDAAIEAMSAAGDYAEVERLQRHKTDDMALLGKITQHWFRHKLVTDYSREEGGLEAAAKQGGWKSVRSMLGYLIKDTKRQGELVERRGSPRPHSAPNDAVTPEDRPGKLAQNPHINASKKS